MKGYFYTNNYYVTFNKSEFGIAKFCATLHNSKNDKVIKCFKATSMSQLMNDVSFYLDFHNINIYE